MPKRSFDFADLVQLPRVNAPRAVALGTALSSAFRSCSQSHEVPDLVVTAHNKFARATATLRSSFASKLPAEPATPDAIREADVQLDLCFSSLYAFVQSWTRVPAAKKDMQKKEAAAEIVATIFPDGLKFTQLSYPQEWAESQARIDLITNRGLDQKLESLGGGTFLQSLRAAHKTYGEVLGLTQISAVGPAQVELRAGLDTFLAALRTYVVKVAAVVDEDDPATAAVADALLAPLKAWTSTAARSNGGGGDGGEEVAVPVTPVASGGDGPFMEEGTSGGTD